MKVISVAIIIVVFITSSCGDLSTTTKEKAQNIKEKSTNTEQKMRIENH